MPPPARRQVCQLLQSQQDAAVQMGRQQCWQDTLMRLYLRGDGSLPRAGADTLSACSLDLGRPAGNRLELPLEKRPRAGSAGRPDRPDEDRVSVGDAHSLDSLENGDVISLLDTPSSCASSGAEPTAPAAAPPPPPPPPPQPKPWVVGKSGGLTLDLSHLHAYEGAESGSQTPGSAPSTPSPLEGSKGFLPGGAEQSASSTLTDDSFLFADNISLGESFSNAEVQPPGGAFDPHLFSRINNDP